LLSGIGRFPLGPADFCMAENAMIRESHPVADHETMQVHCNCIVSTMAESGAPESDQFSITLPVDAIEEIENGLIHFGHYGKKRATVAAQLILDMLKKPEIRGQILEGRDKAARRGIAPKPIESLVTGRSPKGRSGRAAGL
jgi:hypothetical protein